MSQALNLTNYSNIQQALFVYMLIPDYGALRMSTYDVAMNIVEDDGLSYAYAPTGVLLSVSEFNNELTPSKNDITISLTGIDQTFVAGIMGYQIKGSPVVIRRGFFDPQTGVLLPITGNPSRRFSGVISNYSFSDEYNDLSRTVNTTVSVSCSNIVGVFENMIAGQKTSHSQRKYLYNGDLGFQRVSTIATSNFDFGKPV